MSHVDIIRAWKDEDYRLNLSDAQRAMLPDSPVGLIELSDVDMGLLAGGWENCIGSSHKNTGGGIGSCGSGVGCSKKDEKMKKHRH